MVLYLNGGPAGLFNSAGSFVEKRSFGVTPDNVRPLGNGLVVDARDPGNAAHCSPGHMASISFRHGLYRHELSRAALMQTGSRSNLLLLAGTMTSPAPIRCAVVNNLGLPVGIDGAPPAENGVTLERVLDWRSIPVLADPAHPSPGIGQIAAAYDVTPAATAISDLKTTLMATELLLRSGTSVVFAQAAFVWPGRSTVRHPQRQRGSEGPGHHGLDPQEFGTFLARASEIPGRNVVVVLMGEFSRHRRASRITHRVGRPP